MQNDRQAPFEGKGDLVKNVANYRILTPSFARDGRWLKLPGFDAIKTGFRILDSVVRSGARPRRQKRVVGMAKKTHPEGAIFAKARRRKPVVRLRVARD